MQHNGMKNNNYFAIAILLVVMFLTIGAIITTAATVLFVPQGGTGASTLTDHGVLVGSGTGAITPLSVGTNGQLLVGSTGADPAFATLNCADALTCTTGAGTLEIDFDGGTTPAGDLGGTWASPTVDDITCTDCLNATEIEDIYVLNTGDIGTGSYTFPYASTTALTVSGDFYPDDATGIWNSSGSVGIGDITPSQLLDIDGTNPQALIEESTTEFLRIGVNEEAESALIAWDDGDALQFGVYASPTDTTVTARAAILADGSMGLGTTTPQGTFHLYQSASGATVNGTADAIILECGSSCGMSMLAPGATSVLRLMFGDEANSAIGRFEYDLRDDHIGLFANGGERFRIDSSGFIGIATTTPDRFLTIQASAAVAGTNDQISLRGNDEAIVAGELLGGIIFSTTDTEFTGSLATAAVRALAGETHTAATTRTDLAFYTTIAGGTATSTEKVRITGAGNLGIGHTAPTEKLNVQGTVAAQIFTATSTTAASTFPYASSTAITVTGQTDFDALTSAVVVADSGGVLGEASTQTCTNQFVRAMSNAYIATCATVQSEDINLGDVFAWTGTMDMGAAVMEIPNGTGPTADDPGELAHDTSDHMLVLDDFVVGKATQKIWSVTVASTSPEFIGGLNLAVPVELDGYTITAIRCKVDAGTSKVIAVEDASANSTEDITCTTSVTSDDGTITNAAVTAAEEMYIDFGSTSGTVDTVSISVFGQWTRE